MKAIVVGATGQVGSSLVRQLLQSEAFSEGVDVLVRRPVSLSDFGIDLSQIKNAAFSCKVVENFDLLDGRSDEGPQVSQLFSGGYSHCFCCLGTTRKQTPDPSEYYKIDHDYPVFAAQRAKEQGIKCFSLVSSMSASPNSSMTYFATKGKTERDIIDVGVENTLVYRPAFLYSEVERPGASWYEKLSSKIAPFVDTIFPGHLVINVHSLARCMVINALNIIDSGDNHSSSVKIYENTEIYKMSNQQV